MCDDWDILSQYRGQIRDKIYLDILNNNKEGSNITYAGNPFYAIAGGDNFFAKQKVYWRTLKYP